MNAVGDFEREKRAAAEAAAELVESGMIVGLGTGSTVAYLLPALAARRLDVRWVSSSPATERAARALGMQVQSFLGADAPNHLDLTIDGADQATPSGWLVKGGGGAHTREKALAAASERLVVIVSSNKLVHRPELRPARAPRLRAGGHTGAAWTGMAPGCAAQPGRRGDRRLSR
jgi:ribose 5-phosphate isomerase A